MVSENQFLSLRDQIWELSEASSIESSPSLPLQPVGIPGVEQKEVIEDLRGKVKRLEQTILTERNAVKGLHEMVVGLNEKVDSSQGTALTSRSNTSGPVSGGRINLVRECDIVCKGIERSEKLILQLISTRIASDYVDIALIRKYNTIDLSALQSASKTCEKSLLKYLSFPGVRISTLLDNAESWALHIVQAYTSAEVHSIKGSPEDIADVGIFSNNADKTVFEFPESFELGYIDWGNN